MVSLVAILDLLHHTCAMPCDPMLCVKLHVTSVDPFVQPHTLANLQPLEEVGQRWGRLRLFQLEVRYRKAAARREPHLISLGAIRDIGRFEQSRATLIEPVLLVKRLIEKFSRQPRIVSDL